MLLLLVCALVCEHEGKDDSGGDANQSTRKWNTDGFYWVLQRGYEDYRWDCNKWISWGETPRKTDMMPTQEIQ